MAVSLPKPLVSTIALMLTGGPFLLVVNICAQLLQHSRFPTSSSTRRLDRRPAAFHADFAFSLDQLTLVMLLIVTGVGFLIHIYSVGYMAHEEGYWRFFAYLNLFMFFMLTLVLAENFLLMFVGWEGVGLASYLLIGFYFAKNSAADAGNKAFVVNRIGDFGFLLAMFLLIAHFGTLSFSEVFSQIAQHPEWHGGVPDRDRALPGPRRNRQIRADSAVRLAARRDGRPDSGLRPHPRRHHGHRRRLHGRRATHAHL